MSPRFQKRPELLILALALVPVLCGASAGRKAINPQSARPNVVFIMADDLGWGELGCYGQRKIRTPNIDRLASQGMRFTQYYSGAPVCAPSRNVLMTGLHTGHTPIRGNLPVRNSDGTVGEGQHPIPDESLTIAEVFKEAGYTTGAIGKWGLGPVGSTGDPNRQGFDLFFGYNCQSVAHSYYPPHLWRNNQKIPINSHPIPGHERLPTGEVRLEDYQADTYSSDVMEAEAVRFIEKNAKRPFFLYLPFIEPHVAMHPPKRLVDSYPASWDDHPYRGQSGYLPHPRPRAAYAAMITNLDEHVGKVMDALKKQGIEKNTLVVFTSDNGTTHMSKDPVYGIGGVDARFFNSTRELRAYKGSVYEGGIRVPFIVRWPGRVPAKSASLSPAYAPDHFATLCEVIGKRPAGERDGVSLLPLLTGKSESVRRKPMVWVFPEYGGQVAVRLGDYKVVRQQLKTRQPGPWEVYDLSQDPGETEDLSATRPDLIDQAKTTLRAEMSDNPRFPVTVPDL